MRWVWDEETLPEQVDAEAKFAQPPVTLFRGRGFYIAALFWVDAQTAIHQHSFAGAFQLVDGASLALRFGFDEHRYINAHLRLGEVLVEDVEVLEPGDTRPIRPGRESIHAVFHMDGPSLTLLVRQYTDPTAHPQLCYLPPSIAFDPSPPADHTGLRRLQLLSMLARTGDPLLEEMAGRAVGEDGALAVLGIVTRLVELPGATTLAQRLVDDVRRIDEEFAVALHGAIAHLERARRSLAATARVRGRDEHFLLGLLTFLPSRDEILRAVEKHHPGTDPRELAVRWACSIVRQTHGIEIAREEEQALESVLAMPPHSEGNGAEGTALTYFTRDSRLFEPLFR